MTGFTVFSLASTINRVNRWNYIICLFIHLLVLLPEPNGSMLSQTKVAVFQPVKTTVTLISPLRCPVNCIHVCHKSINLPVTLGYILVHNFNNINRTVFRVVWVTFWHPRGSIDILYVIYWVYANSYSLWDFMTYMYVIQAVKGLIHC